MNDTVLRDNVSANNSSISFVPAQFQYFDIILRIITTTATISLNLLVLFLLVQQRQYSTSFTIYLIFLTSSNLLYATLNTPLEIFHQFHPTWPLAFSTCTLQIYGGWIISPITNHTHALITLNRIWATYFPLSYRNGHTKRTAMCICGVMCLFVHVVLVPFVAVDAEYYRDACGLNALAQPITFVAVQLILFDLPIFVVIAAYPLLLMKQLDRMKIRPERIKMHATTMRNVHTGDAEDEPIQTKEKGKAASLLSSRAFRVLTLITASIFICCTISPVYYTTLCFVDISSLVLLQETGDVLYSMQAALDPVLLMISLGYLRVALVQNLSQLRKLCTGSRKR